MMLASRWSRPFLSLSSVISQSDESSKAPACSAMEEKQSLYITQPISRGSGDKMREGQRKRSSFALMHKAPSESF